MADASGPTSSLPGSVRTAPRNMMCDDHQDRPATKRVQGETDSFGAEYADMCEECYTKYRAEAESEDTSGCCDWCKTHAARLRAHRDMDEGMAGPVYRVCDACIDRESARLADELGDYEPVYGCDDFDDDLDENGRVIP